MSTQLDMPSCKCGGVLVPMTNAMWELWGIGEKKPDLFCNVCGTVYCVDWQKMIDDYLAKVEDE